MLSESSWTAYDMVVLFNQNSFAANVYWYPAYWVSLPIGFALSYLLMFSNYKNFWNAVLEWLYDLYNNWQICAVYLNNILPETWEICQQDTWKAS